MLKKAILYCADRSSLALPVLRGPARRKYRVKLADARPRKFLHHVAGRYERESLRFIQHELRTARVFADIGAGHGLYTRVALEALPPGGVVVAFEPRQSPQLLALADGNVGRLFLREEAIGDTDSKGLFVFGTVYGYAAAREGLPVLEGYDERTIVFRSLDSLIAGGVVPAPDVLKVDVEGFETKALTGMRDLLTSSHPVLAVECHTLALLGDVLAMLCDVGYQNAIVSRDRPENGPWHVLTKGGWARS